MPHRASAVVRIEHYTSTLRQFEGGVWGRGSSVIVRRLSFSQSLVSGMACPCSGGFGGSWTMISGSIGFGGSGLAADVELLRVPLFPLFLVGIANGLAVRGLWATARLFASSVFS